MTNQTVFLSVDRLSTC